MTTRTDIEIALKVAMKEGLEVRKQTLRMILAAIKFSEIDKGSTLDEGAVAVILQKEIKNRRESLADAQKANRPDLIAEAEAEIAVVEDYLPKALSEDEIRAIVKTFIQKLGATSLKDMGRVIKAVMAEVQGRAAGDKISAIVKEWLQ